MNFLVIPFPTLPQLIIGFLALWGLWVLYIYRKPLLGAKPKDDNGPPTEGSDPGAAKRVWSYRDQHPAADEAPPFEVTTRQQPSPFPNFFEPSELIHDDPEEGQFEALEQALDDIAKTITDNKEIGSNAGLLEQLKPVIQQYPALDHPTFKAAFFNLITRAAFQECGLSLTQAEVETLWRK